jgi:competence protein ComGC
MATIRRLARQRAAAFTLMELLVVIEIIAVLMALLLLALRKARQAVMNTKCASQPCQLATSCESYLGDRRVYPEPLFYPALKGCAPLATAPRLLNELALYTK